MAVRYSTKGLKRTVNGRWYDPSISQYVRVELRKQNATKLEKRKEAIRRARLKKRKAKVRKHLLRNRKNNVKPRLVKILNLGIKLKKKKRNVRRVKKSDKEPWKRVKDQSWPNPTKKKIPYIKSKYKVVVEKKEELEDSKVRKKKKKHKILKRVNGDRPNEIPPGYISLEDELANKIETGIKLISEFIKESKLAIKDLRKVTNAKKYANSKYILNTTIDAYESRGFEISKFARKKRNVFSKFLKPGVKKDHHLIHVDCLGEFKELINDLRTQIEGICRINGIITARKKRTKAFFEEGFKLIGISNDLIWDIDYVLEKDLAYC